MLKWILGIVAPWKLAEMEAAKRFVPRSSVFTRRDWSSSVLSSGGGRCQCQYDTTYTFSPPISANDELPVELPREGDAHPQFHTLKALEPRPIWRDKMIVGAHVTYVSPPPINWRESIRRRWAGFVPTHN